MGQYTGTFAAVKCDSVCTVTTFHVATDECSSGSIAPRAQASLFEMAKSRTLLAIGCSGALTQISAKDAPNGPGFVLTSKNPFSDQLRKQGE